MEKDEVLAELEKGYQGFRALFATLPAEAYSEVWLGSWSLEQVLAHMAGWYRAMATGLERVGRGERPTPEGADWSDVDALNASFATQAKAGLAAREDWDAAYGLYRGAAAALPAALYGIDPAKGTPRIGNRLLDGAGIHHFAEHGPQLRDWLAARAGR